MDDDADMKLPAAASAEGDDMDLDGAALNDSMMSSQSQSHQQPQSFTPLQSRRLPQPAYSATLCPSMDLIVMGLGSGGHGHGHHHHHHHGSSGAGHHHHHGHSAPRDYSYLDNQNLSSGGGGGGTTSGGGRGGGRAGGSSLLAGMDSATATLLDNLHLAASPAVSVHRTISWQKLFTLGTADLTCPPPDEYDETVQDDDDDGQVGSNGNSGENGGTDDMEQDTDNEGKPKKDDAEDDDDIVLPFGGGRYNAKGGGDDDDDDEADESSPSTDPNATAPKGCTALCWSPDGRSFAIGLADGGVLVHDVERSMDGGVGGAVHSLPPGPVRMAPPLPSPSHEESAATTAAASTAAASDVGAGLKTPAKPAKVTTRSMTASRRLRSGRRGAAGSSAGTAGAGTTSAAARGVGGFSAGVGASSDDDAPQPMPAVWKKGVITGLAWSRVSPPHPSWEMTEAEEEREDTWRYRSHYLDKSSIFLPSCAYNPSLPNDENCPPSHPHHHGSNVATDDEEADEALLDRMARPTCRTPLSVLFVTTCANGTSLYLHGRYRILTLAPPAHAAFNARARTVCSTDLGTFLTAYTALPPASAATFAGGVVSPSILKTVLSLYTVPAIPQHRYELQTLSSLYCSIMAHIRAIGKGLQEASSAWNGALRQLDQKFDQVVNLLRNYGALVMTEVPVDASTTVKGNAVRSAFRNYIISARSQRYASAASALDQFFGAPLMNDQLLQRMIRALEASVRSVEGQLRKYVLAPSRSLVWDCSELKGLVGAMSTTSLYGDQLVEPALAYNLCQTVENLRLTIETCLRDMIDIRCRLQDVLGWIRSTASAVKAKDTAKDSALRENARKRRVDDSVVRRVAGYFAGDIKSRATNVEITKRSISECVLGIAVSDYFSSSATKETLPDSLVEQGRSSVRDSLGDISANIFEIFQQPRKTLIESFERLDIEIIACGKEKKDSTAMNKPMAIHSRVGAGSSDSDDKSASGCFRPRLDDAERHFQSSVDQCRHWMIIAKVGKALVRERPVIQILAVPCVAFGSRSPFDDDSGAGNFLPTYYLESFVFLPQGCAVSSIEFYGDDGSSSPGASIAETIAEGRQGLGILVESSIDGGQVSEELFLFSYDELCYRYADQLKMASQEKSKCLLIQEFNASEDLNSARFICSIGGDGDDGFHEDFGIDQQFFKHRILRLYPKLVSNKSLVADNQATRFALGGSRGVGGIFSEAASSMELYDLEEDEEEDEEDEGMA